MPETATEAEITQAVKALAHPARVALLRLVNTNEWGVGDLALELGIGQAATSQHLRQLRDAGLVTVRADGNRRLYRTDAVRLAQVRAYLDELWAPGLDDLKRAAEARAQTGGTEGG